MNHDRKISRRLLLKKGTVAATGAMAIPYLIPSGVLAREGQPGANDRIGVAGIGVGRQGTGDLKLLEKRGGVVVAVADVDIKRAKKVGARFGAEATQDYRRVLERKDVDAIITATTDHWRSLVCIHACQAGKDVYAEKPMTLTIAEGRKMVDATRKYNRVFQTGSQQRSMAPNRLGCELIRNGRIGKIKKVIGYNYPSPWNCALPGQPVPDGLDWDMWCGPTPLVPYHHDLFAPRAKPGWISFQPYSGGEMTGWGSHGFDQIQWALGMDESGPVEIWTDGLKFDPPTYDKPEPRKRGEEICAIPRVNFRYANGIVVELGRGNPGGGIFIGDEGKIEIFRNRITSNPAELVKEPLDNPTVRLYKSSNHMQNWLDCIKTREKPVADVETGHRSATMCHLGNIARWLNRRLRWDPEKEVFPGDAEANSYLDRPRRKPYELPEIV
ncbi:MAG: Gfo/Idh/MocA family oxidoreductase [Pirellulales bacterium]|nr:Gfo/Idh/MocA family oxidoreductase [Pirellulales bacterium]